MSITVSHRANDPRISTRENVRADKDDYFSGNSTASSSLRDCLLPYPYQLDTMHAEIYTP